MNSGPQMPQNNIQQNYPKCDNIGQTIDTILENVKILSNPQLSHEFSSQFSKLRSNYNLLNDQVQDLRRYKLSEHQDKLLTNIDVTIGKALHVCSTIGNIQQTDNFEYLWANLDGLKSEFDSSVDQFGIQTNRPNERSRTNSNERQSTANIPPPQNQSVLNINQFKLTVCDINSLFQQITLLPKSQEWETSSTLKEIFYKFETLVSIYDNTQWHTASLGPQYCTVFKTFLTDMNNFLNKLESKRSVHEKYTKVKKNEFNTIIETLDKSIKKLMPTEHGLHRPPEYQVPSASSSNSGYFPSFSFNSLNFVSGIYNNWRDNSGSNKKAQEDSAELARWEEENRRFEKQKNEAREKRKREEEQEERQFKESLKLLDESRREKERKLQELLLRQKEEAEEEALRRLANDSEIEQKLEKIRYENEQKALQNDHENSIQLQLLKDGGQKERQEIEDRRIKEKNEHEKRIKEQDNQFIENQRQHEIEENERKMEFERKQTEHEEKLQQMYEQFERDREEMQRQHQERADKMKQQWEQIMMMIKHKMWNDIIERNWTNRLNVLRSANKKVAELFNRFFTEISIIQREIEKSEDISMERKRVSIVLNTLTNSLKQEKELMTEEMKNLQIQYDNTGKSFVWKIKESVEIVAYECGIFENVLREYSNKIQQKTLTSFDHDSITKTIKWQFDNLSKFSRNIPTLAELKQNYSSDMQNNTSSDVREEGIPTQSVIIEEVE
ncbi:Protein containing ALS2cr12 (ALS2CR12) signature [Caenorhabditis elegans]|uniref:Protein containing ALS2cr12 (ALS2CR12) signature n=1 Tax=Caenorhabditis elegans TaxID=6239 RepID=J7SEY3_CAEEL|nr:Protein containing ALS2cr12 (ALS2CR12) signature [Caenorhabditis elegans]CCM09383.1 Protein containing ALS2cr12 (ALS2CR12) signature [Caenorhabditis elegans]|eukprot:NP_001263871.1 Protein containing ALS2cr12 (ALS2CR12) signature [Caenorhabditis elegans]